GYPPVVANVSNTIGLAPGSVSGAIGYRRELSGQRSRLIRLGSASLLGGLTGAVLLIRLPEAVFETIVPVLILLACVLVLLQPRISRLIVTRHDAPPHGSVWVWLLVAAAGVYGGYFGAAQGVLMIPFLVIGLNESLQRVNAAKNVLVMLVNGQAAVLFMFIADVDWLVAGLVALGAIGGGLLGAAIGRRLPPRVLRILIVVVGVIAVTAMLAG
ncbi:MAG: TSUP family transporter, partial [Propionibacteriales bacterium]|nr:TSUP family transporter [Propionibacteriales bacterium]